MLVLAITSLLAVLLTYLESIGKVKFGMKLGFCLITFIAAIHYDYGRDYMAYFNEFKEFIKYDYSLSDIIGGDVNRNGEFGWGIMMLLFKPFGDYGFLGLIALLSIIENIIYYKWIHKFIPKQYWAVALFIYLFTGSLYALSLSGLRQLFAVSLFVQAYMLMQNKTKFRTILAIFTTLFAVTVHTSAIILLPVLFLKYIPLNNTKYLAYIITIVFLVLYLSKSIVGDIFNELILVSGLSETYGIYEEQNVNLGLGLGFLINQIPFIMALRYLYYNKGTITEKQVVILSSISTLLIPFQSVAPIISRLAYYFYPFAMLAVPITYYASKQKMISIGLLGVYIIFMLYQYYNFFHYDFWIDNYLHYKSVFSLL